MGNQRENFGMEGTRGAVGNVVFRQKEGKTIVARKPVQSEKGESARAGQQRRFLKATIYAKNAMLDPALAAAYATQAKKGRSAYTVAVTDYLTSPVFDGTDTDLGEYFGRAGDKFTVGVLDGFKVVSVTAVIRNAAGGLIEAGPLAVEPNSMNWTYTLTADQEPSGCEITVTAKDRAGNRTQLVIRP